MPFTKSKDPRTRNKILFQPSSPSEENTTPSVEQRLRAAVDRAAARLSQEQKTKSGVPKINDGNHEVALVKEKNERILTPSQTKAYDAKHPSARKQPKNLDSKAYGLPRVRGLYDDSGLVDAPYNPQTDAISDAQMADDYKALQPSRMDKVGSALGRIGSGSAIQNMPGDEQPQEMLDVSHPPSRLQWQPLGQLPSYDDGGTVQDDTQVSSPDDSPKMRPYGMGSSGASTEPAPAQRDLEQEHIDMRRDQINQKQDQAIANGDLIDQGKSIIAHRQVDAHEAKQPTQGMPRIAGTEPEVPVGALGRIGGATPDLIPQDASMPKYTGPGKPVAQGDLIPAKQLPTDEYKYKQGDLDKRIEAARDAAVNEASTPAERASAKTLADNLELRREELKRPAATTMLGRIGRGFETAGNIAGNLVAAPEMSLIPGTTLNKAAREQGTLGRINTDIGQEKELAGMDAKDKAAPKDWQEVTGGAVDPSHPELGQQQAFYDKTNPNQRVYAGPMAPKEGAESKPLGAEGVTNANSAFADRYQILNPGKTLPQQYVLPPNATKADFERVDKQMEQVEKAQGTKAQQEATRQAQKDARADLDRRFEEGRSQKLINYRDKNGDLVSGTREEAQANGISGKDIHGETSPALQEKARQAYTQYARMNDNAQEAYNNLSAWNNETDRKAAMDVSKQYWDHMSASVVVVGAGVNPEYTQQFINSDAYRRMSPEGRELMQSMFQVWSDALNVVKQETGGVPRGQIFLQKEDAILPHPDKTQDMNRQSLLSFAKRMHTDAQEYARPSDMKPLPETISHIQTINGQEVQVSNNGTFQLNGHTYKMNPDGKGGSLVK